MGDWSRAAQSDALAQPLLDGPKQGGGDVTVMLRELQSLVRTLRREPDHSTLSSAWVLAESIQACLRPPAPATLTSSQRRDLRSALLTLQQLSDSTESKQAENLDRVEDPQPMEIEAPRRQLVLQEEQDDSYERELEDMTARDIAQIAGRVNTVNQIYRDIADLVNTQQEDVDSIEAAVQTAHGRTAKGQEQLVRANRKKSVKMKCCFYFAVGLTCFAVLLIISVIGFSKVAKYMG